MKVVCILVLHAIIDFLVHPRPTAHSKGCTPNRKYSDLRVLLDLPLHGLDVSRQVIAAPKVADSEVYLNARSKDPPEFYFFFEDGIED